MSAPQKIHKPWLAFELLQSRRECIHRQVAGVIRSFGQTADSLDQVFSPQPAGRFDRSSLHELRECRTASHGRNATFGKKTDFRDMAVCNLHGQF